MQPPPTGAVEVTLTGIPSCSRATITQPEARTVDEAIQKLNENWPGIRDRICEKPDRVRKHINVFVDGYKAQLDTHVPRNGQLTILTAIIIQ